MVPSRDKCSGRIEGDDDLKRGMNVFSIDSNEIPSAEQIKEIWFTFNLIVNYINNKNLRNPAHVNKFILWVEMAQKAHPLSGYMSLFLALGHVLAGNREKAQHYQNMVKTLHLQEYWQCRIESFNLNPIIDIFPENGSQVISVIESLRDDCKHLYRNT